APQAFAEPAAAVRPSRPAFDKTKYPKERLAVDSARASFPNLGSNYEVMAPGTARYNCIAWSLGITDSWVWPGFNVADFDKLDAKYGYRRLKTLDFSLQPGVKKIVLY